MSTMSFFSTLVLKFDEKGKDIGSADLVATLRSKILDTGRNNASVGPLSSFLRSLRSIKQDA